MKIALNFKDKDTFRKLERQAYDGTIDVTKFPPAEYRYFSELIDCQVKCNTIREKIFEAPRRESGN